MKVLGSSTWRYISGGDNDGNAGEAQAAANMQEDRGETPEQQARACFDQVTKAGTWGGGVGGAVGGLAGGIAGFSINPSLTIPGIKKGALLGSPVGTAIGAAIGANVGVCAK